MSLSPPVQIKVPFATGGLKNAIPANANPTDGHAGYDVGFPAINMTPKTAGGIPPFGQDFNGIFFEVSTAIQFLEAGGSFPYSSVFSTAVGGYPLGALVSRTDGAGLWRNTVANNTTDPEAFGAGWQPEDAGSTAISMTNASVTLTALQAARSIIIITGVLTANLQLIMPAYVKQWLIVNNCTGAFTITAKTAAGSGVTINTGFPQDVYGDGTNISASAASINQMQISGKTMTAYLSSGVFTFTVPALVTRIRIRAIGGGGGAGGSAAAKSGGGGGGGGYSEGWFAVSPGASITITVGGGGAGGTAGNVGVTGGTTSVGALLTASGGAFGDAGGGGTGAGGFGGTGSGGQVNSVGGDGGDGTTAGTVGAGQGGGSILGGVTRSGGTGRNALGIGGGGSASYTLANNSGGNGFAGAVIVEY